MTRDLTDFTSDTENLRGFGGRRQPLIVVSAALLLLALGAPSVEAQDATHRLGVGVMYWEVTDELLLGAGIEYDGVSVVLSYQYQRKRSLFRWELDLEYFDGGFGGSSESAFAPVAFLLVGNRLYFGLGVGLTFSSGFEDDPSDPFYASRLGYQFDLLPGLRFDVNLNYRTNAFDELGDFETDALTLGAFARIKLR